MAAEGLHHYCRHLGLSPRDPSGPRTVDLGVCNNDGGLRPPSIILYYFKSLKQCNEFFLTGLFENSPLTPGKMKFF